MSEALTTAQPLATTLDQIGRLNPYSKAQIGPADQAGWVPADQLLAPESRQLAALLAQIGGHYQTTDRRFIAMTAFNNLIWQSVVLGVGGGMLFGRVPDLSSANLTLRLNAEGWPEAVALANVSFTALPNDAVASHPAARVADSPTALREAYLRPLRDEFAPRLIAALRAQSPLGEQAMWSALADRLVGMALWLGKEAGQAARGISEAQALIGAVPRAQKNGIFWVEWDGARAPFLKRGSCCYSYKLPKHGYCTSCPLQSIAERLRRFQDHMAERHQDS